VGGDPGGLVKQPAIKGTVMVNLVEDVLRLRGEGRISEEELAARLEPRDLEVLEEKILPTWYPIDTYRRLTELLLEKEGGGEDYLRERGAGSARRLLEAGMYEQMRRLRPGGPVVSMADVERSVRALVTMSQTILNFGRGEVLRDPQHEKRLIIQISEAAAYPEVLRFTSEGFYNACVRAAGRSYRWRSSRPAPDRILMHMDADFDA
jgi:hypothetical protein